MVVKLYSSIVAQLNIPMATVRRHRSSASTNTGICSQCSYASTLLRVLTVLLHVAVAGIADGQVRSALPSSTTMLPICPGRRCVRASSGWKSVNG